MEGSLTVGQHYLVDEKRRKKKSSMVNANKLTPVNKKEQKKV